MSVVHDVRWIIDELRALGETVVEIPGWPTRGDGPMRAVDGWVNHYDAIPSDDPVAGLRVVTFGRADLRNSLSMFYVDGPGVIYVVAAGVSWHAGRGTLATNTRWAGVEIRNRNLGAPMPAGQRRAVLNLNRVCRARWGYPLRNVIDHKEHTDRKSDRRGVDSSAWRDEVGTPLAVTTILEEDDVPHPKHITAVVHTPSGKGYYKVSAEGGVFAYGDAPFFGSIPGLPEDQRRFAPGEFVVGMVLELDDAGRVAGYALVTNHSDHTHADEFRFRAAA